MTQKVLSLKDNKEWSCLLSMLPADQQDVYFTPEYYALYEQNGDGKACCFVYEENGKIVLYPFLINTINKLGYKLDDEYFDIQGAYGYNGIVTSSKDEGFLARFHETFDTYCQEQHIVAEFSRFHPLLYNQVLASPKMQTFYSRKTVKLNLSLSEDEIWMGQFSSKNRNVIRKAEKEGVTIVESQDYDFFREMYDQTMRNVNAEGFYFFPPKYYDTFKETFGRNLELCFAMYEGKPIAGSMFMFSKDYAHYHLSGRDKNYYKIAANNAVLWYGIQKAKERGCKWFHFGGGTTGADDDLLLHFKQNFSKENGEFRIGKRVHNQEVYDQIVEQWKANHPDSYEHNKIKLLGYREI
jgi:hypothetical protein